MKKFRSLTTSRPYCLTLYTVTCKSDLLWTKSWAKLFVQKRKTKIIRLRNSINRHELCLQVRANVASLPMANRISSRRITHLFRKVTWTRMSTFTFEPQPAKVISTRWKKAWWDLILRVIWSLYSHKMTPNSTFIARQAMAKSCPIWTRITSKQTSSP